MALLGISLTFWNQQLDVGMGREVHVCLTFVVRNCTIFSSLTDCA